MEILFTSIVAAALAMAQRGSPANLEFCTLFSNGSFGAADGCKSRPTVSAMGAERGVPKARCQPGSDFSFSQVISHRRHEMIENVGVNFVEGIVIQSREIIAVRKRSEEHTSELQSRLHLVCRLLLEKKKTETRTARNVCITM